MRKLYFITIVFLISIVQTFAQTLQLQQESSIVDKYISLLDVYIELYPKVQAGDEYAIDEVSKILQEIANIYQDPEFQAEIEKEENIQKIEVITKKLIKAIDGSSTIDEDISLVDRYVNLIDKYIELLPRLKADYMDNAIIEEVTKIMHEIANLAQKDEFQAEIEKEENLQKIEVITKKLQDAQDAIYGF